MSTRDRTVRSPSNRRRPPVSGATYALLYTAAYILAGLVALAPAGLSRPFESRLTAGLMRGADWTGRRVYWPEHDWIARARYRLCTHPLFRAFARACLDDAVSELDEAAGYVGTVGIDGDVGSESAREWLECRLYEYGFHRNETAYLKARERAGRREFETSSWVLRETADAERQLHLRLYDGPTPGTVDVYAHWEPSITQGEEHYAPPDYATGVCMTFDLFETAGVPFERLERLPNGVVPIAHDRSAVDAPLPIPSAERDGSRSE